MTAQDGPTSGLGTTPGYGVLYRATDVGMPVVDLAHAVAERGFGSLLLGEHTHIPTARATPFPAGGELPEIYRRFLDPFAALSFVAAQTELTIGTGVALIGQHDPIVLAKTIATIDHLSGGRFVLGVGYGWNREEFAAHGRDHRQRRAIVREHVAAMRSLWHDDIAEFHGEHVELAPSWAWPKPVQQPSPPVLLGCTPIERNLDELVSWADGWLPGGSHIDWFADGLGKLRARWEAAGRDETGPAVWVMQDTAGVDVATLCGQLEAFRALGAHQVLFDVPTTSREELLPLLDHALTARSRLDG